MGTIELPITNPPSHKPLQEVDDMKMSCQDCCNYVSDKTRLDYTACKALIYAMIYGLHVMGVCKQFSLTMYDVVDIRTAFDDWTEGR